MLNLNRLLPTIKRLFTYARPYRRSLMLAVIMLLIASAAEITGPIMISYFIDHILPKKNLTFTIVAKLLATFIALQLLSATLRYYQALIFNRTALNIIHKLRAEVMDAALHQPLSVFDKQPVGHLISKVTNDTEVIKNLYVTVVASLLRSVALISTMLVAMFLLDWHLASISLIMFPAIITVMWLYQHYSMPIVRLLRNYIADINNGFNEAINGMGVIQQFRQQKRFGIKLNKTSYAHFQIRMANLRLDGYLLRPMLSLLFALILCGMMLLFVLSPRGTIGVGVIYAFINYLGRLNEPIIELTSLQFTLQQAIVAAERIFELIDGPMQYYGPDDRPITDGTIEVYNLDFSYCGGKPVLHHISLTVPAKSFIAIVGHTGSGKSTLANLIMGYYPVRKGTLFLDNRPIENLSHKVLRQGIAMVQQEPVIMADTIYANISLGRNIDEHKIWHVLEQVQMAQLVRALPNGIYAELGERGNILSVGQKQLIALARVLVSAPSILILDEATANIDSYTEHAIVQVLQSIRQNTTILVIAHRLSTIVDADQILVLYQGKAIERGTHSFLMQLQGHYYQMYQLQQIGQDLFNDYHRQSISS